MMKKGFTYIEVIIAISVFAILILTVMKLNVTSENNLNSQINSQKMMFVAQQQIEKFKTTLSTNAAVTNIGAYPDNFKPDNSGYYIVAIGNNTVTNNSNLYLVTIWVRISSADSSTEIKLQSHVTKK